MENGDMADQPLNESELFREVFDLADELVEQITDTQVEARLRRLLEHQGANRQNPSELTVPEPDAYGMSLAEGREGGAGTVTDLRAAYWALGGSARVDLYEVTLGPAAQAVLSLPDPSDRKELADALRTELVNGPNADKELELTAGEIGLTEMGMGMPDDTVYRATPLSFGGYTAIHRPMTEEELKRLQGEQGRPVAADGFYVADILLAESAFSRRPRPLV